VFMIIPVLGENGRTLPATCRLFDCDTIPWEKLVIFIITTLNDNTNVSALNVSRTKARFQDRLRNNSFNQKRGHCQIENN
jgi:hypothetical protein